MVMIAFYINQWLLKISETAYAASTNEVKITEPAGGDVLLGKTLFRQNIESGIKDSVLFSNIIPFIINYGIKIAVALAILALVYGGYQIITAFGETEKRQEAEKTITWALVGLVIALTAYGLITLFVKIKIV